MIEHLKRRGVVMMLFLGCVFAVSWDGTADAVPRVSCRMYPCSFSLIGGPLELNFGGSRLRCNTVAGSGRYITEIIGITVIELRGCRESVTVLNLRCHPAPSSRLGTHIRMGPEKSVRMKLLGLRLSFSCAEALVFRLEGYLIGDLARRQCNTPTAHYLLPAVLFAHAQLRNSPPYDVYVRANRNTYRIRPSWRMKFSEDVTISC